MSASANPPRWAILLLILVQAWFAAGFATGAVNSLGLWVRVLCGLFAGFLVYRIVRNVRELVRRSRPEVS